MTNGRTPKMLWVRRSWGYVLGGVLLTKLALTGGTLAFTTLLNGLWGQPVGGIDAFLGVIFVTMLVAAAALLVPFLGAMAGPARARVVEAGATT